MGESLKVDYAEPAGLIEKLRELGLDPDFLPEKLNLTPVPFIHLKSEQQEEVVDFYSDRWEHVLVPEYREGNIKPSENPTGLPLKDVIRLCVWDQLRTSGNRFPDGQMVLTKKIKGKERPIVLTRSQIWHVRDIMDDEKYFENYPITWYLVSGNGKGYPYIPMLVNGKIKKFRDYKKVLDNKKPELNLEHNLVISSHALTKNTTGECDVDGASRAAVIERAEYAIEKGIKHCDTFSPLNNYAKWVRKKKEENPGYECTPNKFIEENVVEPLNKKEKPEYYTAVGMHMKYGATSMRYFPDARVDPDSLNYCGMCRYF